MYGNIKPYLMQSLSSYQDLLKNPQSITKQPGYLFRLQQGLNSVGIATGDKNLTGAQIRRGIQYSQDYATNEYTNALARIAGLGALAQGTYQTGAQYATNTGNAIMQGAQGQAQGITGAASARAAGTIGVTSAINQGLSNYSFYNMMNQPGTGVGSNVSTSPITNPNYYYGGGYIPPGGSSFNTPSTGYNTQLGAEGTGFATY